MSLLETAKREVEELKRQRDALLAVFDARIAAVEESVRILEPVYGSANDIAMPVLDESVGITEAIERALRKYPGKLLPPTSVRNALLEMGYRVKGDNPMASVHQVLKRLVARAGSPYVHVQVGEQTMYKFDPSREPVRARFIVPETSGPMSTFSMIENALKDTMADAERLATAVRATSLSQSVAINAIAAGEKEFIEAQRTAAARMAEVTKGIDLSKHAAIKAISATPQRNKK